MILVAIGSNLNSKKFGPPLMNCIKCIKILKKKFDVLNVSNLYETEPIPKSNQVWYINGVVSISSILQPIGILKKLHSIEMTFGRVRKYKNEPRTIDLDLLCYNNSILKSSELVIPHPKIHERRFVLQPICDIDPEWIHPVLKEKAKKLLKNTIKQKIFLKKDLNKV